MRSNRHVEDVDARHVGHAPFSTRTNTRPLWRATPKKTTRTNNNKTRTTKTFFKTNKKPLTAVSKRGGTFWGKAGTWRDREACFGTRRRSCDSGVCLRAQEKKNASFFGKKAWLALRSPKEKAVVSALSAARARSDWPARSDETQTRLRRPSSASENLPHNSIGVDLQFRESTTQLSVRFQAHPILGKRSRLPTDSSTGLRWLSRNTLHRTLEPRHSSTTHSQITTKNSQSIPWFDAGENDARFSPAGATIV